MACVCSAQAEVVIDTVAVGNAYTKIGKFEVTAAQYADFLNAVAATDGSG